MSNYRYDAFISYRHTPADTALAKEIQQQLEHFRIPESIQKATGKNRIQRVFRDQEELDVTSDLSQKLQDNLRDSEYLIAICSPSYLQSRWCQKEIEDFIRLHDRDHIICVLCEGEPPAVFPEALKKDIRTVINENGEEETVITEIEPLAVDYRGSYRTARKVELPRLAARIIGCSYDELVMRQERYRRKRMAIITAAIAALSTMAITYLLWSNHKINTNYRLSQINESKLLAQQSLTSLSDTDRYSALKSSLEALPDEKTDRPVVDEAVYALSKASNSYVTPFDWRETMFVDRENSITDYFVTSDGQFLVFMESNGEFSTVDLANYQTVTAFDPGVSELPQTPHEGVSREVISYADGMVIACNYLTGEISWQMPLKYQQIGMAAISHDKESIAAADSYAVQVMTAQGVPFLSMPLPDDVEGYITDLIWSDDDAWIAVRLRRPSGNYRIGVYEFETSAFHLIEDEFAVIDDYCFLQDDSVAILGASQKNPSAVFPDSVNLYNTEYHFVTYRNTEKKSDSLIISSSAEGIHEIIELDEETVAVVLGNGLYLYEREGSPAGIFLLEDDIVAVTQLDRQNGEFALDNGYRTVLNLQDGSSVSTAMFPADCQSVTLMNKDSRYIALKSGNLYFYQPTYDENLSFFADSGTDYQSYSAVHDGRYLTVLADQTLLFADSEEKTVLNIVDLPAGHTSHLLEAFDQTAYILLVNASDGSLMVAGYNMTDGREVYKRALGLHDCYITAGLRSYPLDYGSRMYLEMGYRSPGLLTLRNHRICLHDITDPETLTIYDLDKDETVIVKAKLPSGLTMLRSTSLHEPSGVAFIDDDRIYTTALDISTGSVYGLIISLADGDCQAVIDDISNEMLFAAAGDRIITVGSRSINEYDTKGNLLHSYGFSDQRPLSLDYHDDRLFCVYPDGKMVVYQDGKAVRHIRLSLNDTSYLTSYAFNYDYHDDRLYLSWGNSLDVISLNSDSTTPLYSVDSGFLTYLEDNGKLIMHCHNPITGTRRYYLGCFDQYSTEQLIARGTAQLETFSQP